MMMSSAIVPAIAGHNAFASLEHMRKNTSRHAGRVSWPLVRDLVWLASGANPAQPPLSEKTFRRRYLVEPDLSSARNEVMKRWREYWETGRSIHVRLNEFVT